MFRRGVPFGGLGGPKGKAPAAAALGAFWAFLVLLAGLAHAQAPAAWVPPPEVMSGGVVEEPPPAFRPRMSVAVGMGTTFDGVGFPDTHVVPAFFATGGVGDGLLSLDFEAFASSAVGRVAGTNPVDRLSLSAFGVVRPAARLRPDDRRYGMRVLHTVAGEAGLGLERAGRSMASGTRFVVHLGARVELPLTPAGQASELRVRLGVSRCLGLYTPTLPGASATDATEVVDTLADLYGALVVVF
jgi:hypothetical protein